jgi:hypothetical protein
MPRAPGLSDDDILEVVKCKTAGWEHKKVADWLGCTVNQVQYYWSKHREDMGYRPEFLHEMHRMVSEQLAREVAAAVLERKEHEAGLAHIPPYKPGPLVW